MPEEPAHSAPPPESVAAPAPRTRRRVRVSRVLLLLLAVVAWGVVEGGVCRVRRHELAFPDYPAGAAPLRAAFLTDFHLDRLASARRLGRIVDRVNAEAPDIIFLGGDYADAKLERLDDCLSELARLKAPLGVWAVLGNHDHVHAPARVLSALREAGITPLENEGFWLDLGGGRIRIGGVADFWHGRPDWEAAAGTAAPGDFFLLLAHNPDYTETLPPGAVDLVLAGHTHDGQATVFGLWSPFIGIPSRHGQKYRAGVVDNGRTTVLVSGGAGGLIAPMRYFAPPSVEVVTLRADGQSGRP
ncbi:MAG TPA: metallophosphoesterase [Candidatus Hydrogenedentes bacterium]|nr:metallophosphoesterase [Candidatus Hydrogenedentota bacterium]HOC72580.1 metallophosphoesterase [Candidatus Hydrogenedentota bacterium]